MENIGIVEGFFGPQWPETSRLSFAGFLAQNGGGFYIYAPKQDPHLRKAWREEWSEEYLSKLHMMKNHFHSHRIDFGVGFSPFGLGTNLSHVDQESLIRKIKILNEVGIDILGLFFDDMPINENLAETQIETLNLIRDNFKHKIIFCPSFYTPDPILEKVFGKMPDKYLEKIAEGVASDVSIAWTGPKVISPEIPKEHLVEVSSLLKRKPFIWENLYANDGPRNCKFLKLKPFIGRTQETFQETEAFAFNMMNQPELSKIVFLSSILTLKGESPETAFDQAMTNLCSPAFKSFLSQHKTEFLEQGLEVLDESTKEKYRLELSTMNDPAAREISDWLKGDYIVGTECLTD